jgi:hypothetical protein
LLDAGLNTFKRRSLVFVISDFISEPGWERPLNLLNRRHELVGIRLWDPREVELPDAGMIVVEDAETGEQLLVDTGHPEFRRRFFAAAERREAELKTTLKRAGVDLFGISTEEDLVGAIVRMASLAQKAAAMIGDQHRLSGLIMLLYLAYHAAFACCCRCWSGITCGRCEFGIGARPFLVR